MTTALREGRVSMKGDRDVASAWLLKADSDLANAELCLAGKGPRHGLFSLSASGGEGAQSVLDCQ